MANETFPVPDAPKTLETYGNVINGKIKFDAVSMKFIIKLNFTDLIFMIYIYSF